MKSWRNHTWYLDPSLVVMVLASKGSNNFVQMEEMAKVLFVTERKPLGKDRARAEMPPMHVYLKEKEKPPSLSNFIKKESWALFNILGLTIEQSFWMELPHQFWYKFPGYIKFQDFVKSIDVVNDCSERPVKLIQQNVEKAKSEDKLLHLLQVKNAWQKPVCRTKSLYKESANKKFHALTLLTN